LGIDGRYDKNNVLISDADFQKFIDYKVYVDTTVVTEKPELFKTENEPTVTIESGSPAIIIGKYALMASHTNDPEEFNKFTVAIATPFGMREKTYVMKVLEHKVTISIGGKAFKLTEKYRNTGKDFSLYEFPDEARAANFPFVIGDSSEMKVGDYLYINGRPALPFEVARPGHVTALATVPDTNGDKSHEMEISMSSDSGDSSSPIIAFRDGRPELIGIYLGWVGDSSDNGKNTRSRALRINSAIDEIKEKLGIDLREVQRQALSK
jgi:hypothetical protein